MTLHLAPNTSTRLTGAMSLRSWRWERDDQYISKSCNGKKQKVVNATKIPNAISFVPMPLWFCSLVYRSVTLPLPWIYNTEEQKKGRPGIKATLLLHCAHMIRLGRFAMSTIWNTLCQCLAQWWQNGQVKAQWFSLISSILPSYAAIFSRCMGFLAMYKNSWCKCLCHVDDTRCNEVNNLPVVSIIPSVNSSREKLVANFIHVGRSGWP